MRSLIVVLCVVAAGCQFQTAVPDSALIECESNADCPPGWRCSSFRKLCQQRDDSDLVAPVLSATLSRSLMRPGEELLVTVTSDEPLLSPPVVEARTAASLRALEATASDTFRFAAAPDEADGLVRFFGSAADRAGNESQGILLGAVLIDGTAPTVANFAAPTLVAPGSDVVVNVAFDEEVRAGAVLVVSRANGAEVTRVEMTADSTGARFEFPVDPLEMRGTLHLEVQQLVDLAGNVGATFVGTSLEVDADGPIITSPGISGRRFSAQSGFDQLAVPVMVAGASQVQACLGTDCRDVSDGGMPVFQVVASLGAGPHTVLLRARDEVGNRAELAEVVFFDFSPPVGPTFAMPRAAVAPGTSVTVAASFDEVLAPGTRLDVLDADGGTVFSEVSAVVNERVVQWVVPVPAQLPSTSLQLRLSGVADPVGNALAASVPFGTLEVDADAPVITSPALQGHRYSAQPTFNEVRVPVTVSGAASILVCLDSLCRNSTAGQTESFPVSGTEGEGPHTLAIRALDGVGNRADLSEVVTFDFTGPQVLGAQINYLPPVGCPLTAIPAATVGATARLFFATDEQVSVPPVVSSGSSTFISQAPGTQSFSYSFQVPAGASTSVTPILASLIDDVGNASSRAAGSLAINTTAPPPMSFMQHLGLLYRRLPFGTNDTGGLPSFTIEAQAGSFPGMGQVRFAADPQGALLIASLAPAANGSLPRTTLSVSDTQSIYFQRLSPTCTPDATWSRVKPVEWSGTASSLLSPMRVEEIPVRSPHSRRQPVARVLTDTVAGIDSSAATTEPTPTWSGTASSLGSVTMPCVWPVPDETGQRTLGFLQQGTGVVEVELPGASGEPVRARTFHDGIPARICTWEPIRQRLVMSDGTSVWEYDGVGWEVLRPSLHPSGVDTLGAYGSAVIALWNNSTWSWDGTSWSSLQVGTGPNSSPENGPNSAMAENPFTGKLVFNEIYNLGQITTEFDGAAWTREPLSSQFDNLRTVSGPTGWGEFINYDGRTAGQHLSNFWAPIAAPATGCSSIASAYWTGQSFVVVGTQFTQCRRYGIPFISAGWDEVVPALDSGVRPNLTLAQLMPDPRTGNLVAYAQPAVDGGFDSVFERVGGTWVARGRGVDAGTAVFNTLTLSPDAGELWLFGRSNREVEFSRWVDGGFSLIPVTGTKPTVRTNVSLATNFADGTVVVIGGRIFGTLATSESWTFNGSGWTRVPGTRLAGREGAAAGWDPERNVVVAFSGKAGSLLADTWELRDGGWVDASPPFGTPGPEPRTNARLVWDVNLHQLILTSGSATSSETWGWNGARWSRLTPQVGAPLEGVTGSDGTRVIAVGPTYEAALQLSGAGPAHRASLDLPAIVPPAAFIDAFAWTYKGNAPSGIDARQWNGWNWNGVGFSSFVDGGSDLIGTLDVDLSGTADWSLFSMEFLPGANSNEPLRTDYIEARVRYVYP